MWAHISLRVGTINSAGMGSEVWEDQELKVGLGKPNTHSLFYCNIYTGKLTVSVQLHLQEISRRQTKARIDKTQL